MRDLSANDLAPAAAAYGSIRATGVARRTHLESISKLVLNGPRDRALIEAVGGYPARLQSCVLAAWLRGGWQLGERAVTRLVTSYLKPWTELDDEAKEFDREAVRNIAPALADAGWGVLEQRR